MSSENSNAQIKSTLVNKLPMSSFDKFMNKNRCTESTKIVMTHIVDVFEENTKTSEEKAAEDLADIAKTVSSWL